MTEVARKQASRGRSRVGDALLERRRREVLADLGERVYELAQAGQLDLDGLPELAQAVDEVASLDERRAETSAEAGRPGSPRAAWASVARTSGSEASRATAVRREPMPVWRPPADPADLAGRADEASSARPARPTEAGSLRRRRPQHAPAGGGIAFVDDGGPPLAADPDADLVEFMHPDDVPRPPSDD